MNIRILSNTQWWVWQVVVALTPSKILSYESVQFVALFLWVILWHHSALITMMKRDDEDICFRRKFYTFHPQFTFTSSMDYDKAFSLILKTAWNKSIEAKIYGLKRNSNRRTLLRHLFGWTNFLYIYVRGVSLFSYT